MQGLFLIGWSWSVLVIAFTASINFDREQVTSAFIHSSLFKFARLILLYIHKAFVKQGHIFTIQGQPSGTAAELFALSFDIIKASCSAQSGSHGSSPLSPNSSVAADSPTAFRFQGRGKRLAAGWKERWLFQSSRLSSRLLCLYLFPEPQISLTLGVWTLGRNSTWPLHPVFLSFKTWRFHLTSSVQTSSSEALYNTIVLSNNTEPVNECAPSQGQ